MSRNGAGFDRLITVFSPEGRLYQIEYAFKPIACSNITAIAVRGADSCTVDRLTNPAGVTSMRKFNENVGGCFVGLQADFLNLATRSIYEAQDFHYKYGMPMPCDLLAQRIGALNQVHTQVAGQRPLGCCIILIGVDDEHGIMLYKVDPSGLALPFRAVAVGGKQSEANGLLERKLKKRFPSTKEETCELALSTLIATVGADLKATELEVAEVSFQDPKFKLLSDDEVEAILNRIADKN